MRHAAAMLLSAALLGLAGCGGSDEKKDDGGEDGGQKTFESPGFEVTFKYPDTLTPNGNVNFDREAGGDATTTKALGLDKFNLISIQRYGLKKAVTKENIDATKPEIDRLFSRLGGRKANGKKIEVGGLPGFEFTIDLKTPTENRTRASVLFDGNTEYLVNCQSTAAKRAELQKACNTVLESFEKKG